MDLKNFGLQDEHTVTLDVICDRLQSDLKTGLTEGAAIYRLAKDGFNRFTRPKPSGFKRWVKRKKPTWSKQEWDQVFNSKIADRVIVIREGERKIIDGSRVVAGDIVELNGGDKTPADIRIIYAEDLLVNNLLITGEKCVIKSERCTSEDPLLSENMVFACTKVLKGMGTGIVLRTGDNTVFGCLNRCATKVMVGKQFFSSSREKEPEDTKL